MNSESELYLSTAYEQFIHKSRYARFLPEKRRRETWIETVDRYVDYMFDRQCPALAEDEELRNEVREAILCLDILPSMRAMMTAGAALERDNACGYNCSYLAMDEPDKFSEMFYLLMCGTGVGFSCERKYVERLPSVPSRVENSEDTIRVADSKIGWAHALRDLVNGLYRGRIPRLDTGRVRPAGSRLKTMGGRASGPGPLQGLYTFVVETFRGACDRRLTCREVHEICCKIGEIVVVGGVRRCLASDATILVRNDGGGSGYRPARGVRSGDFVATSTGWRRVVRVEPTGERACLELRLANGRSLVCTPEHRLPLFGTNRLVRAQDLRPGDELVGLRGLARDYGNEAFERRWEDGWISFRRSRDKNGVGLLAEDGRVPSLLTPVPLISVWSSQSSVETFDLQIEGCEELPEELDHLFVAEGVLVHNSALISLSDLDDEEMRRVKSGNWWERGRHLALANNSAVYERKPTSLEFMREWLALGESGSGERGIFNRHAIRTMLPYRAPRRRQDPDFGTNPCSEIVLRDREFCNLTEVVVRSEDGRQQIERKVRLASIVGTMQSTLVDFRFLHDRWRQNCVEERLLGVSFTGICDNPLMYRGEEAWLESLRTIAVSTNRAMAKRLGIRRSAAVTCVKPAGTTSQLAACASGIHPQYTSFYIRRVRIDKKDPMYRFLRDVGVPAEDDAMHPQSTAVFSFPKKAPDGARVGDDVSAIDQLELWLKYQRAWCEHKPSITVTVRPDEWFRVGNWVYDHFDEVSGVSFLPHTEHTYRQAPYERIDRETYEALRAAVPEQIDWSLLDAYDGGEDCTAPSKSLACTGDRCEMVDLVESSGGDSDGEAGD